MHSLAFIIRVYHDARSSECQILSLCLFSRLCSFLFLPLLTSLLDSSTLSAYLHVSLYSLSAHSFSLLVTAATAQPSRSAVTTLSEQAVYTSAKAELREFSGFPVFLALWLLRGSPG